MRISIDIGHQAFRVVKAWGEFRKSCGQAPQDFSVRQFLQDRIRGLLDEQIQFLRDEMEDQGLDWQAGHRAVPNWHRQRSTKS